MSRAKPSAAWHRRTFRVTAEAVNDAGWPGQRVIAVVEGAAGYYAVVERVLTHGGDWTRTREAALSQAVGLYRDIRSMKLGPR